MEKYVPPEKMSEAQIRAEVEKEFHRWNTIAHDGCSDPGWPDGANMNLVRNHIIYWYNLLRERAAAHSQLSLFGSGIELIGERPIPPEVPDRYMVMGCKYSDRLDNKRWPDLVWGRKGEYHA